MHIVNLLTLWPAIDMAGFGLLSVIICVGFTSVCHVVSHPFFAYHKLPANDVPVNCWGNSTVYEVSGLGHSLCGGDYIYTKKENLTQFGKVGTCMHHLWL